VPQLQAMKDVYGEWKWSSMHSWPWQ